MIGWKAKYGYSDLLNSLSDLTFTDDGPFTIGTQYTPPSNIVEGSFRTDMTIRPTNYLTRLEAANALEATMGDFFSEWYAVPYWGNIKPYNLELVVPSLRLACPNLWGFFSSKPTFYNSVVYIPGLKRVLSFTNRSLGSLVPDVLVVGEDGSLTNITPVIYPARMPGTCLNGMCQAASNFICVNYDGTKESIINVDNMRCTGIGFTDPYGVYAVSPLVNPNESDKERIKSYIQAIFGDFSPPDINIPDNPYEPGGESGEGGGGGNFDDTSDPIPDSSLPTLSSSNTGFTRIYNPSLAQVQDLAQYLWTDESVIQTIWNHIKQFMENPMDAIIGFNLVPCVVPNGGTKEFALMYIGTGVQMTVAANQFVDVDCGTCELTEYFGSALDYAPYTKISCFLPYIGTVELNVDEVMKTTLQVKYRIDICSGSCVAKILVNGNVLYQYSGHCAISIPISAADFSSYVSAAISVAKLAIGAAVGGGMGAAASLTSDPSQQTNQIITTTQTTETARNPSTGRQITMGTRTTVETRQSPADQSSTQASFSGLTPNNIANTVGQIMSSKPHVEHSGSFSGNTGYLGVRRPYLIITRPNQCMPNQYQQFNGFPSMISQELSTLSGFTKVQQVQLTGMTATNPEQAEILEFLKSGVVL